MKRNRLWMLLCAGLLLVGGIGCLCVSRLSGGEMVEIVQDGTVYRYRPKEVLLLVVTRVILGAVLHNIGQITVAMLATKSAGFCCTSIPACFRLLCRNVYRAVRSVPASPKPIYGSSSTLQLVLR